MAAVYVTYTAWDTAANGGKGAGREGDAANHSLFVVRDGEAEEAADNAPAEIGGGQYRVLVATAENAGTMQTLRGTSATANVVIIPTRWQNRGTVAVAITPTVVQVPRGRYQPTALSAIEKGSAPVDQMLVVDANGDAVDLRGRTLKLVFHKAAHNQLTPLFAYTNTAAGARLQVGVADEDKNELTVNWHEANTANAIELHWILWDIPNKETLGRGIVPILDVPAPADYPAGGGES